MAGFDSQLSNPQITSPEASSSEPSAPWRASYGEIAPLAQQATGGTQPQEVQTQGGYSNGYSNVTDGSPIYYAHPQPTQTVPYDAGTYGQAPESVQETGTYRAPIQTERTPSQFSPTTTSGTGELPQAPGGMNGNTMGYSPYQGGTQDGGTTGMPQGDTSGGAQMRPEVDGITATFYGGLGGALGATTIPKLANRAADGILGTESVSGPSLLGREGGGALSGMFSKLSGTKIFPQSWKDQAGSIFGRGASAGTDGAAAEAGTTAAGTAANKAGDIFSTVKDTALTGAKYDATAWQNNFNPQYANRVPYQDIVNADNKTVGSLTEKAAGGALSAEETTQLANAQARLKLLTTPENLTTVNPKLFTASEGPELVAGLKSPNLEALGLEHTPFTPAQEALIGKQSAFIDAAAGNSAVGEAAAGTVAAKDASIWSKPGVSDGLKGAGMLFGSTLANDYVDQSAGGENALHFGNYGIAAGLIAGDGLVGKLGLAAGAAGVEYGLDKILPAQNHITISNLMAPTKFDALMQGVALTLPGESNTAKLGALGAAWGEGRLSNMGFLPSVATTGALGTATAFLMKDPEARAGAITLEAGAWGVSRIMHALDNKK